MKIFIICFVFLLSISANATFLPPNNLYIPDDQKALTTIDENRFNAILDAVEGIYSPIFKERGLTLKVIRRWSDGTVNADTSRFFNTVYIRMFGGLARHQLMTEDGLTLVICHEIGHNLGGFPKSSWATNEGQSDYFSTSKCMRKVLQELPNNIPNYDADDEIAVNKCEKVFYGIDAEMCIRSAFAGKVAGKLFAVLSKLPEPQFGTPDKKVVDKMYNGHPEAQCRVDTYLAGAVCKVSHDVDFDNKDYKIGACNTGLGVRPTCWFKP